MASFLGTIVEEVTFSVYRTGEQNIINMDKYKQGSFERNRITSRSNCVEAELKIMPIRASGLGKTPGIQATVKSGEEKMRGSATRRPKERRMK